MTRRDWESPGASVVGLFLNGRELGSRTPEGEPVVDDSFVLLLNAAPEPVPFAPPPRRFASTWELALRTADPGASPTSFPARGPVEVEARSLVLLRAV